MRTLVHLSDLHYGRVNRTIVDALRAQVLKIRPDLLVISGDLTQRARTDEFAEARTFVDSLPFPQIIVPGNHDVPLYNVWARGVAPFTRYRRYITPDMEPYYADSEMAVAGINTARSLTFKGGRISRGQVARACDRMASLPQEVTRIIVTHHPFDLPSSSHPGDLVGRAHMAMAGFARSRVDIFLSGHLHESATSESASRYKIRGHSALVIQAGTATSTRWRGECNSWNLVRIDYPRVFVTRFIWKPDEARFAAAAEEQFEHRDEGWYRVAGSGLGRSTACSPAEPVSGVAGS